VQAVLELAPPLTTRPHAQPAVLAFSDGPAGHLAYVACLGSASVVVLDSVTRTLVRELDVGDIPSGLAADGVHGVLYVLSRGDESPQPHRRRVGQLGAPQPRPTIPSRPSSRRGSGTCTTRARQARQRPALASCHVCATTSWPRTSAIRAASRTTTPTTTDVAGFPADRDRPPRHLNPPGADGDAAARAARPDCAGDLPGHWRGDGARCTCSGRPSAEWHRPRRCRAQMQELQGYLRRTLTHPIREPRTAHQPARHGPHLRL
jgi:hypothetical protein